MKQPFVLWVITHRNFKEIFVRVSDMLVGYLLRPFSFLAFRNRRKWVIGNKTGFTDNSKYLFIHLQQYHADEIRAIWIASSSKEEQMVKECSLEVYRKWSWKGLYHSLTAGVYIFSSCSSDINYWTSGRAIKVNLWHGVGIKKLGLKESDVYNPKDILARILTPYIYAQPDIFVTTSELMTQHFRDCYALSETQTKRIGYSRCDFLLKPLEEIDCLIKLYEDKKVQELSHRLERYKKVYIYMPTFRDDQSDFIQKSGIDFKLLDEVLYKKNEVFLLKIHPATRMNFDVIGKCTNVILLDKSMDVYPLLPKTDVLITDYSSIYYDYILMPEKDVLLFPFDYQDYIRNSRDLAYDYLTYTPGVKVWNFDDLLRTIKEDKSLFFIEREWAISTFWGESYNNASKQIIDVIKEKCRLV